MYFVFARAGIEGAESLVAVVESESDAAEIEADVIRRLPGSRVSWEVVVVQGSDDEVRECVAVMQDAGGDDIVLGAFSSGRDASEFAHRQGSLDVGVRQFIVGWRGGWPFSQ